LEEPILSKEEVEGIFSNHIESFLSLSQVIFFELLKLKESGDIEAVGEVFAKQGDWLKCYKDYVAHTADQLERLKRAKQQNARFATFLDEIHETLRQSNVHDDLSTLLIRPSRQLIIYLQSLEVRTDRCPINSLFHSFKLDTVLTLLLHSLFYNSGNVVFSCF
jgi:hypothetical protein